MAYPIITVNGENIDFRHHIAVPVKWNELLDERLDEGRISVRHIETKLFPIGSAVSITVGDTVKDFILIADEGKEVPVGSGRFDHELAIMEPTKLLEGIVVESLTFTNNLGRTYASNPVKAEPIYE